MKKFNLYIHIPFCQRICIYCDFYVSTARKLQAEFTQSLCKETGMYAGIFPGAEVETVYFGGGTPSVLSTDHLARILETVFGSFEISPNAEVTLECNPNNLTKQQLERYRQMGINRLSIGTQSFEAEELKFLTRNHDATQAKRAVFDARDAGFSNISIDLIFGIPGQSADAWKRNIDTALALIPDHISVYNLTVEERTYLHKLVREKKIQMPDEEVELDMFQMTIEALTKAGYEHYEISNYASPGYRSRHNSSYWSGNQYLGLGPSAHSFDGHKRWWNVRDIKAYDQRILQEDRLPLEGEEELSIEQKMIEAILLGLRKCEGLEIERFRRQFGLDFFETFREPLSQTSDFIVNDGQKITLTRQGLFLYNRICETFVSAL